MPKNEVVTLPTPTRPGAAHSLADIERLAEAVAKSGMFGIRTKDQALVLMAISQAEGRHPALAARDYDIIQGRPVKKAEAMLRDFIEGAGRVEWHELTDLVADATFSHPAGGSVRIRWDTARVATAGLASKDMHKKYPRQMLRSRCVSEGIRTVFPMATSGMYEPGEAQDMPMTPSEVPTDTTSDLDSFAADTGEIIPAPDRDILPEARAAASRGTTAFRAFWSDLSPPERDSIRTHLEAFATAAKTADDPFGLPPLPVTPPPPDTPRRSAIWQDPNYRIPPQKLLDDTPDWNTWAHDFTYLIGEATTDEIDKLRSDNKDLLNLLRRSEYADRYAEITDAVTGRIADITADAEAPG